MLTSRLMCKISLIAINIIQAILLISFIINTSFYAAFRTELFGVESFAVFGVFIIIYYLVSIRCRKILLDHSNITIYDVGPILLMSLSLLTWLVYIGIYFYGLFKWGN